MKLRTGGEPKLLAERRGSVNVVLLCGTLSRLEGLYETTRGEDRQ